MIYVFKSISDNTIFINVWRFFFIYCRLFNASHYGSSNLASNLTSTNLSLGSLGSVSPTASNMSACMVQGGASSSGVPVSTGMTPHVTPHSPSEAKSGYPYLGGIDSQVCGRVHWIKSVTRSDRNDYTHLQMHRVSDSRSRFIVIVIFILFFLSLINSNLIKSCKNKNWNCVKIFMRASEIFLFIKNTLLIFFVVKLL